MEGDGLGLGLGGIGKKRWSWEGGDGIERMNQWNVMHEI